MMKKEELIPKRRFKEFQNNSIWKEVKFGDLIQELTGGASIKPEDYQDSGIKTIPKGAVNSSGVADLSGSKYVNHAYLEKNITSKVLVGDLVTSLRDLVPTAPNMGRIVELIGSKEIYLMPQGVYRINLKDEVDKNFVIAFSNSNKYREMITVEKSGSTQVHIRQGTFLNTNINVPCYEEQQKIGQFFKHLDEMIALEQRKIDKTKALKSAYLTEMFPAEGERIPKRRFEGFTGEWEVRKLGDLVESFEYGLNASAIDYDGENKYLRITDIDDDTRLFNKDGLTSPNTDLMRAENYLLKKNDILFARTGASVGKTYHYQEIDGKVYYAGFLIRGRIKSDFSSEFVYQNTITARYDNFIKITSQRSGQPGVNAQEYAEFQLLLPDKEEQIKISEFFKKLDSTITNHQGKLEKLKGTKQAYLNEMFV